MLINKYSVTQLTLELHEGLGMPPYRPVDNPNKTFDAPKA